MANALPAGAFPFVDLGKVVAEDDQDLRNYFVETDSYRFLTQPNRRCAFFIGKKGAGKSAMLQMVRLKSVNDRWVNLPFSNVSYDMVVGIDTLKAYHEKARSLIFRAAWTANILCALNICSKKKDVVYGQTEAEKHFARVMSEMARGGKASLLYPILRWIKEHIKVIKVPKALGDNSIDLSSPSIIERLATEELMHSIEAAREGLGEVVAEEDVYVLIDDLDEDWSNEAIHNQYLRALFEAIEKFRHVPYVHFVVALRLDIFQSIGVSNPDKLADHRCILAWSLKDLEKVIHNRIKNGSPEALPQIIKRFNLSKHGDPLMNVIKGCMEHPRDVVYTFQELFNQAHQKQLQMIDDELLSVVQRQVSADRIQNIIAEWGSVYPWLAKCVQTLRGSVNQHSADDLSRIIGRHSEYDIEEALYALLHTGICGYKTKKNDRPEYFLSSNPPLPPYTGSIEFEIHPSMRAAIQSGRWLS